MGRRRRKNHKPIDRRSKIEVKVERLLCQMELPFIAQARVDKYTVDFLIKNRYVLECYGDFWHCNPTIYSPDFFNRGNKQYAAEIWDKDSQRQLYLEKQGFLFLAVWETEINGSLKIVSNKLKQLMRRK